jgi:hypothetical protein
MLELKSGAWVISRARADGASQRWPHRVDGSLVGGYKRFGIEPVRGAVVSALGMGESALQANAESASGRNVSEQVSAVDK